MNTRNPPATPLIAKIVLGWFIVAAGYFVLWAYFPGALPASRPAREPAAPPGPAPWSAPAADGFASSTGRLWIGTVLYQHGREVGTIRAIEKRERNGAQVPMVRIKFADGSDEWKLRSVVTQYFQVRAHQLP